MNVKENRRGNQESRQIDNIGYTRYRTKTN